MRLEHCDIETVETSVTSTWCVETRQMSFPEDICLVSAADICPVSTEDTYPVSRKNGMAAGRGPATVMFSVERIDVFW